MSEVSKEQYGVTEAGEPVYCFTLKAGDISVRVINEGCSVKDILVPDKEGKVVDVNLGYGDLKSYEANPGFLGCVCGRVANRIDGATFELDGTRYSVSKNDPLGNNMCHGGFKGFSRQYFDWSINGTKLVLTYVDKDGTEGFPGDVTTTVTYELTSENGLMMDYQATTNKPTPVDLSNHFLFNLAGHAAGNIRDHKVMVTAGEMLEFNDKFIPTGEVKSLKNTVLDLQRPVVLDDIIDKFPREDGLCHAYILPGQRGEKKLAARVEHPPSGRYMEVHTTEPVVVNYSGYYLDVLLKGMKCKDGAVYQRSGGLLFMPQGYPDAVNHSKFPSCILRPGETYHRTTWYKFGVLT